jgi:hypothetical protein
MTREEHREYLRNRRAEHREEYHSSRKKRYAEHRDEVNARIRNWRAKRREDYNSWHRKYQSENLNISGLTKHSIRRRSGRILEKCHARLPGYEIHHCFGYEDAEKFIYIPRELHLKIHQFLRDNGIPADTDHWLKIRELVNSCEDYTYIRA